MAFDATIMHHVSGINHNHLIVVPGWLFVLTDTTVNCDEGARFGHSCLPGSRFH
jgi:hypothetical protein